MAGLEDEPQEVEEVEEHKEEQQEHQELSLMKSVIMLLTGWVKLRFIATSRFLRVDCTLQ